MMTRTIWSMMALSAHTGDAKPRLFQETIQHAPSERTVRAATLKRKINQYWITHYDAFVG